MPAARRLRACQRHPIDIFSGNKALICPGDRKHRPRTRRARRASRVQTSAGAVRFFEQRRGRSGLWRAACPRGRCASMSLIAALQRISSHLRQQKGANCRSLKIFTVDSSCVRMPRAFPSAAPSRPHFDMQLLWHSLIRGLQYVFRAARAPLARPESARTARGWLRRGCFGAGWYEFSLQRDGRMFSNADTLSRRARIELVLCMVLSVILVLCNPLFVYFVTYSLVLVVALTSDNQCARLHRPRRTGCHPTPTRVRNSVCALKRLSHTCVCVDRERVHVCCALWLGIEKNMDRGERRLCVLILQPVNIATATRHAVDAPRFHAQASRRAIRLGKGAQAERGASGLPDTRGIDLFVSRPVKARRSGAPLARVRATFVRLSTPCAPPASHMGVSPTPTPGYTASRQLDRGANSTGAGARGALLLSCAGIGEDLAYRDRVPRRRDRRTTTTPPPPPPTTPPPPPHPPPPPPLPTPPFPVGGRTRDYPRGSTEHAHDL